MMRKLIGLGAFGFGIYLTTQDLIVAGIICIVIGIFIFGGNSEGGGDFDFDGGGDGGGD